MEHFFELPVNYKDTELLLKGRLVTFAYTYKFYIIVDGKELIFERDDAHQYRALINDGVQGDVTDSELTNEIIKVLERVQSS